MTKRLRPPGTQEAAHYRQLWRIVDGAVRDALNKHPEYINSRASEKTVRASINKRVVGSVLGFAKSRSA